MYIENQGQIGDSKRYTIQLDDGLRLDTLVSGEGAVVRERGEVLDKELLDLVAQEIKEKAPSLSPDLLERANEILTGLGYKPVEVDRKIPLEPTPEGYVRVRHYIGPSKAKDIAENNIFGGNGHTLDKGKVFLEPASWKVMSSQEFQERYAITHGNRGLAHFEFLVKDEELKSEVNPRNGKVEYFVEANGSQDGHATYKIMSEIKLFKNRD